MAELSPFPWQQSLWDGLLQRLQAGRLPHALLLTGPAGLGKQDFATRFSRAILCDSPLEDGSACGRCRGCMLMQAGSHPDYLLVSPEEEGKAIGIEAVRELARFQALKSQYGRQRVIQLQPADALNPNSANALLKTLEEPAGDTILLLTTNRPMALLPTIRSRCQQVVFRPLSTPEPQTVAWLKQRGASAPEELLQMAGGAPLLAVALESDGILELHNELLNDFTALAEGRVNPVKLAEQWQGHGTRKVLPWFYLLLSDMVKLKLVPRGARLSNPQRQQQLHGLTERVDLDFIQSLAEKVLQRLRLIHGQANQQVILEELLLAWTQRKV
jgi:DNA polymerase III subunit delta'